MRLIAVNDLHGALLARPFSSAHPQVQVGGAANLAGWVRVLRSGQPHSLLLGTGDLIGASPLESSLFWDEPTVELLNMMGMDAAVVGNHEFDKGHAELRRIIAGGCARDIGIRRSCVGASKSYPGAAFPWLGANVVDASGQPVLQPVAVRDLGRVRIGIVGVVTRDTPRLVVPSGIRDLRFEDESETLLRHARALRAQGVQAVVALVHEGGAIDGDWNDTQCPGARGRIFEIARAVAAEIDVLFSAHSHQGYNCRIGSMPVMQAFAGGRGASVVDLRIDLATNRVITASQSAFNVYLTAGTAPVHGDGSVQARLAAQMAPDPDAEALAQRHAALARERGGAVMGRLAQPAPSTPLARDAGDSPAGRLVADAQWFATRDPVRGQADFALMNPGGIRSGLACEPAPCEITYGQLFQMQPFGNQLVTMTLSGDQVRRLLEQQAPADPGAAVRFLQPSASLRYDWIVDAPPGQRVRSILIGGEPIDPTRDYRVTVNSFLAEGGDGFSVLKQGANRLTGDEDLKAMVDYLATFNHQPATVSGESRIRVLQFK